MKIIKSYKQYEKVISSIIRDEDIAEFINRYNKLFIKHFKDIFNELKQILIETINDHNEDNYTENTYKFIEHINDDMNECQSLVKYGLQAYDVEEIMRNDREFYKNYSEDEDKYFEAIYNYIMNDYNESLNIMTDKNIVNELEKNPSKWKDYKHNTYNYKIHKKFSHLEDSENFDLI